MASMVGSSTSSTLLCRWSHRPLQAMKRVLIFLVRFITSLVEVVEHGFSTLPKQLLRVGLRRI